MTTAADPSLDDLDDVVTRTIAPGALEVDRTGVFPRADIEALAGSGTLGLLSSRDVGGTGGSLADVAAVLERIARADASTAMVMLMHFAAVSVIEPYGPEDVRRAIAAGEHLSTVAFSERGSRSHFWAPVSSATGEATPCASMPRRAGSPLPGRPTATSGRAGRRRRGP